MTDIIQQAIDEYSPSHVFALFSGGDDSVCALHIAMQHPNFTAAVMIDTGIAVKETHDHARATCEKFGWPLLVYRTPENYDDAVRENGFPGPAVHNIMYSLLKERAVADLVRDHKIEHFDRIALITGVRKFESKRRMVSVTDPIVRSGARVWVAPMWDWTREQRDEYQAENGLPKNPVKDKLHVSGDCLCGAYADKGDFEMLRMFYPIEAARIQKLRDEVISRFPWEWDEEPPAWFRKVKAGQRFIGDEFMPLCWQCENNAPTPAQGGEKGK